MRWDRCRRPLQTLPMEPEESPAIRVRVSLRVCGSACGSDFSELDHISQVAGCLRDKRFFHHERFSRIPHPRFPDPSCCALISHWPVFGEDHVLSLTDHCSGQAIRRPARNPPWMAYPIPRCIRLPLRWDSPMFDEASYWFARQKSRQFWHRFQSTEPVNPPRLIGLAPSAAARLIGRRRSGRLTEIPSGWDWREVASKTSTRKSGGTEAPDGTPASMLILMPRGSRPNAEACQRRCKGLAISDP